MKCKNIKCNKEHDGTFGSGKFCSRACANSRVKTDETKRKVSESVKLAFKEGRLKAPVYNLTAEQVEKSIAKRKKTFNDKLLVEDFSNLTFERLRKRVILEQNGKCNKCGLSEWLGQEIPLELEHKDGNNTNNERKNVEVLCPNCHSLTPTWRGRNKNKSEKRAAITEEEMVRAFLETGNIRQCLLKLNLAAKGANYGRVKRALTLWGIEY